MRRINFDHLASSVILPEVKEAMLPFLCESMGNPLSRHFFGDKPRQALDEARNNVAKLIAANPEEIIFTSSGSESNNLAVKGAGGAYAKKGKHIIASPVEHHSITHPLKNLEKQGYEISWLKVDEKGNIDPQEVSTFIRDDTILITVTAASNDIGTSTVTWDGENGKKLNVDLLSMAGNSFYGPLGVGALYVRKGVKILPLIEGGIQENGLRAGTHNIAGIAGMGKAAQIAKEKLTERKNYLLALREKLIGQVLDGIPDCFLTGDRTNRLPHHASFCIKFIEGESILLHLNFAGIAGTSGSTCSSEALKVSHVLEAIGIDPVWAQGSVVFSLGIDNTPEDVDYFLSKLPPVVDRLRQMSPLIRGSEGSRSK